MSLGGATTIVVPTNRGAYSSLSTYVFNDLVTLSGSAYLALGTSTNITPGTDVTKWQLLVSKGDQGAGTAPTYGTDAGKPSAGGQPDKTLYLSTDINGGTLYQVQSGAWVAISSGVTLPPTHAGAMHARSGTDPIYWGYGVGTATCVHPYDPRIATGACTITSQVAYIVPFTPDVSFASPAQLQAIFEVNTIFTSCTYFAIALCTADATGGLTTIIAQTGNLIGATLTAYTAINTATGSAAVTANAGVYAALLSKDASNGALGSYPSITRGTRYAWMLMTNANSAGKLVGISAGSNIHHFWIGQALNGVTGTIGYLAKQVGSQTSGVLPGTTGGSSLPTGTGAGSATSVIPWIALST